MRYEIQILSDAAAMPAAADLAAEVTARGVFRAEVAAQAGFERDADSPRILLEEPMGARVLIACERAEVAEGIASELRAAPEALRDRLDARDIALLDRVRSTYRLSVNRPGEHAGNAVRFALHVAEALVDRGESILIDPQTQIVWGDARWRQERSVGELEVRRHVVFHAEPIDGKLWLHSHGLVKFDRPDVELWQVTPTHVEAGQVLLTEVARHLISGSDLVPGDGFSVGEVRVTVHPGDPPAENDLENVSLSLSDPGAGARAGAPKALAEIARTLGR